jgi:hypothetical protein
LRIDITKESDLFNKKLLLENNFSKVKYNRISNTRLTYNISGSLDDKLKKCKPKWRYNFNRSKKNNIKYLKDKIPNSEMIYQLSKNLQLEKKIGKSHNDLEVKLIIEKIDKQMLFLKCIDNNKNILGFRSAIFYGDKAWDFFAVTTNLGRKNKVGYFLLMYLIEELQKIGIKKYLFIGEDPIKKKEVVSFKEGIGCKSEIYLGEYEWSNFKIIKNIFNLILKIYYSKK